MGGAAGTTRNERGAPGGGPPFFFFFRRITVVHARRVKQHHDELCEDERLSDPDQLLQRSGAITTKLFQAIQPSELSSATDDALDEHTQRLADQSNRDISPCSPSLVCF